MKISVSNNFREEYCSSIVRIGETFPIEGKDRIVKTLVNGLSIVIGKDEFKTGDIAVYCANETCLNELFLHLNSMYDDKELNVDQEKKGYINKHGRVRVVKLGGVPSYGLLIHPDSIATFINEPVEEVTKFLELHIGEDFDEINGERSVRCMCRLQSMSRNLDLRLKDSRRNLTDSRCLLRDHSGSIMILLNYRRICLTSTQMMRYISL